MQIRTRFFIRLFLLSFLPFLILSLFAVYLFNQGIAQVISPGFEKSLRNSEYLVENSLELYRLRFLNLVSLLTEDTLTSNELKYFDLMIFISASDTLWLRSLDNPDYNRIFLEEAATRVSSFPEIISFERRILVYQKIMLHPALSQSPLLIVGQYLPAEFSQKAGEIISARTEYSRLRAFVESSGTRIAWFLWAIIIVIYFIFIFYISKMWANALIKPVNNLSLAAYEIAKGNWGGKVNYSLKDELGTLVNSFNYMSSELKSRTERLLKAEIEASWKNTAQVIAHGIKNILSPIKVSLYNLQTSEESIKARQELDSLNSEIVHLEEIANDFSQFARSPDIRLVLVNLHKVAEDALKLAGKGYPEAEKRLEVPQDLFLETDYEILRGLLVNLIKNSLESLAIRGWVQIDAAREAGKLRISVSDNGAGIPPEYKDKIWQPYYTTRPRGTGLGLPIACKFAQALKAKLGLYSDQTGTKVTLEFEVSDERKNPLS